MYIYIIRSSCHHFRQEKAAAMPELLDQEGQPLESDEECSGAVEKGWGILLK